MKIGLNLGCGNDIYGSTTLIEWLNVDIANLEGVDLVYDLNVLPLPFEYKSIDLIIMNDILEHLDSPVDIIRECHRLLKPKGVLKIRVLYWNHKFNYSDPTHKHVFAERYFKAFTKESNRSYYFNFVFDKVEIEYTFDPKAIEEFGDNKEMLMEKAYFYCNVIDGMHITLMK